MTHLTVSKTETTFANAEEYQSMIQARPNKLFSKRESYSMAILSRPISAVETPVKIVFVINILLCLISIGIWLGTKSFIIMTVLIHQACDTVVPMILMYAQYSIKKNMDKFPAGRSRLECIGILICSMLMIEISISVIYFASVEIDNIFSSNSDFMVDTNMWSVAGMIFSVILNLTLWIFCSQFPSSPSIVILAIECRNDMLKECVAFAAVCIISSVDKCVWLDPIGGILISLFFIVSWYFVGLEEANKLIGIQADDAHIVEINDFIRQQINSDDYMLVGYHIGRNLLIEVKLILTDQVEYSKLCELCNDLQHKLEECDFVERAFVSFDCIKRDVLLHKIPVL